MARYKSMPVGRLTPDRRIRIVNEHRPTNTVVKAIGPIVEVITEEFCKVSLLAGESGRVEMRPVAVKMIGDITMALVPRSGWILASLEEELPDLPHTSGAVILIEGRAAVLRAVHEVDDAIGHTEWFWADGRNGGPSASQLDNAEILHPGR